ncbi:phytoene desaturase family protein [Serpentinicella alkaliphila]|nr:FAD-dependent oxidoreductase [Serpentinicella alkaliphila]
MFIFYDNFKDNIDYAFTGKLPIEPSFYIYSPTQIDQSMAINNGEIINVVVRVPNLLFKGIEWDNHTIETMRDRIIKTLKNIKGLEDIEDNIEFVDYLTPIDLKEDYNSYAGAAFGLSPTLTQTNYFRPHLKLDTINNLYFVGASVHPGPGVSIVLLSSKLVVQEILKSEK